MKKIFSFVILWYFIGISEGKYVEGHVKTNQDWVFVSRFCFLSGQGRYEYFIEYEKKIGDVQLLLYYDEPHQWHSVYKTSKTCREKVSVLSEVDNQIVTLSAKSPYFMKSGCTLRSTASSMNNNGKLQTTSTTTTELPHPILPETDPNYFDHFLKTTSQSYESSTQPSFTSTSSSSSETSSSSHLENFADLEIDDFNKTSPNFKSMVFDQEAQDNNLENTTEFMMDVEEMFEDASSTMFINRTKRQADSQGNNEKKTIFVSCHNAGGFTSSRQRWWYIALANCGNGKGIDVRYKFRMTNGAVGDFWSEHFSADEMYIPPAILVEILAYSFLVLAVFVCGLELKTRHLYHCTYRLFTLSVIFHWSGVMMNAVTWAKYALTGIGPFTIFGGLFTGSGEIAFLLLMLLMAKGYTITRARLSTPSTVKITVFINIYVILYIVLYIYQAEAFDPGDVLNLYESAAGYALASLRCFCWAFFMISCTTTIKKFPEKRNFYFPFGVLGSIWIMSGPVLIFLIVGLLDPWVRESVVYMVYAIVAFSGHTHFLWLTWPSRANKSFPYHVKTNHIGIASTEDDGADYPRHAYEPTPPDATIIIPLSRRTEEFVTGVHGGVNGGVYNPAFIRDVEYLRNSGPISMPQQCFPSKNIHNRLPSPTNGPPTLTNSKIYGHDVLNDDDDDDSSGAALDTESGFSKQNSTETIDRKMSSMESAGNLSRPSRNSSQDNDSGHLSLEASASSPNSNESSPPSTSLQQQLKPEESSERINSPPPPLAPIFSKENPFKVGKNQNPNKIILDPIKLPNDLTMSSSNIEAMNSTHPNVPRHLFAVKKATT